MILIAALAIILMIVTIALSRSQVKLTSSEMPEKDIFDNIKDKTAEAINIIAANGTTSENFERKLILWLGFAKNYTISHAAELSSYVIVGLPTATGVNITAVNLHDSSLTFNLSVAGESQNVTVANNSAATAVFSSLENWFEFRYGVTADGVGETESLNVSRRLFAITKIKVQSGRQIWQTIEIS